MTTLDQTPILEAIRRFLATEQISFEELQHPPTFTAQEAADARQEPLQIGAKAIVAKVGKSFRLFVLSSSKKIHSRQLCKQLGESRFRFAHREELLKLTGLVPGCVPPFGEPILPLPLFVDESLLENERVAFNAGSHTHSILMRRDDYLRVASPEQVLSFGRD